MKNPMSDRYVPLASRRTMILIVAFVLTVITALALGCGGRNSGKSASPQTTKGRATARMTILWPQRKRLIPVASNSLKVILQNAEGFSQEQVAARPADGSPTTLTFTNLPPGNLTITATAHPDTEGKDLPAQAQGASTVEAKGDETFSLEITLDSTIDHLIVNALTTSIVVGQPLTTTASAMSATGPLVVTGATYVWTSNDSAIATVAGTGPIATVTGVKAGTVTLTATETESGKSATISLTVNSAYTFHAYPIPAALLGRGAADLDDAGNLYYQTSAGAFLRAAPDGTTQEIAPPNKGVAVNGRGDFVYADAAGALILSVNGATQTIARTDTDPAFAPLPNVSGLGINANGDVVYAVKLVTGSYSVFLVPHGASPAKIADASDVRELSIGSDGQVYYRINYPASNTPGYFTQGHDEIVRIPLGGVAIYFRLPFIRYHAIAISGAGPADYIVYSETYSQYGFTSSYVGVLSSGSGGSVETPPTSGNATNIPVEINNARQVTIYQSGNGGGSLYLYRDGHTRLLIGPGVALPDSRTVTSIYGGAINNPGQVAVYLTAKDANGVETTLRGVMTLDQ